MKPSMIAAVLVGLAAAGCAALPSAGPDTANDMAHKAINPPARAPHVLVNATTDILPIVQNDPSFGSFAKLGGGGKATKTQIGVGDILGVTIFEAREGGLFIPMEAGSRSGNFVNVPDQQVAPDGTITVPYAGTVKVAGVAVDEIQRVIQQRLESKAIDPQVVVTLKQQTSSQVSVVGEVNNASKFQLNPQGERLLEVIARAGGPTRPGYDTFVTINRGRNSSTKYFQTIVRQPSENIQMAAGDVVYVFSDPRAFMVFGAAGENGRYNFETENVMLTDALARAGGLLDARANPESVLVYRLETRETATRLGVDLRHWSTEFIPVIYRLDLRDAGGFFIATSFPIRNRDVIYVGNAAAVQFLKGIDIVAGTTSIAASTRSVIRR